jgi:DNA-binding response OmpR family regulator
MPTKILIIDDDLQILKLIGLMLERRGHRIIAATGGVDGLAKAASETPDLIILDLMMDDLDGLEVCRRLRAQPDTARTPILIFTAKSMVSDKVAGFQAGADDYLVKPIHPTDLISRIETALQRSQNLQVESDSSEKARIIGFVGVRGGVGTTTLAMNVGAALASTPPPRKVVLMDLQASAANVAVQLNATPTAGLVTLLHHAPSEITPELVSQQLLAHPSGLQLLLPSINVHGTAESIPADQMQTLLNLLSRLSQAIIIDAGNNIDYNTLIALKVCHQIVLVIDPQRLSITVAQTMIAQLDRHGIKSDRLIIAVINRSSNAISLDKRAMESALKLPISVLIPPEPDMAAQAADQAALILYMQPSSIIADQFRSLAERVMQ